MKEKQRDIQSLQETQRQNAEYEQMMAIRKAQNRQQFQEDLKQQIEFKNMETVITKKKLKCLNVKKNL